MVAGLDATDRNRWQPPQDGPTPLRDLVEELKPQLERAGFPVTTSLVTGGRHSYQFSSEINERAWKFLRQHTLATDPPPLVRRPTSR